MPVFDCHTHIFPDRISAQALAFLSERSGIDPATDGTRAGLVASMQAAGIDGALNCPIATHPDQVSSINNWAIEQNRWPVLSLGTLHPDMDKPDAELRRLQQAGVPGIKLHPEYQNFTLDDPRMTPVWNACVDTALPVLIHAGADIGFAPPYHTSPETIADLLRRYPDLTVIAAHFGGWQMWDQVRNHLLGHPLYLDISFTVDYLPPDELVDMIRQHRPHYVLFGTDSPWADQTQALDAVRRLPLTAAELDAILWGNAATLFALHDPEDNVSNPESAGEPRDHTTMSRAERNRLLGLDDAALLRDCRVDTFRGTGPGGQKRNTTESAVRLTHRAAGISATCDQSRSQTTNRRLALRHLRLALALTCRAQPSATPLSDCPPVKTPAFAAWVAHVFDVLEAAGFHLRDAAAALNTNTARLVRDLARHDTVWQHLQEDRKKRGLTSLKRPR